MKIERTGKFSWCVTFEGRAAQIVMLSIIVCSIALGAAVF